MFQFELNNQSGFRFRHRLFARSVRAFAQAIDRRCRAVFSLVLVDSKTIRSLNRVYRGQDRVTDVLSFADNKKDFPSVGDEHYIGEIVICVEQAKKQSLAVKDRLENEISRLLIHGLAHLCGYEHERVGRKKKKAMFDFEKKVVALMAAGFSRPRAK